MDSFPDSSRNSYGTLLDNLVRFRFVVSGSSIKWFVLIPKQVAAPGFLKKLLLGFPFLIAPGVFSQDLRKKLDLLKKQF